jgi:hypothetical protein
MKLHNCRVILDLYICLTSLSYTLFQYSAYYDAPVLVQVIKSEPRGITDFEREVNLIMDNKVSSFHGSYVVLVYLKNDTVKASFFLLLKSKITYIFLILCTYFG